MVSDHLAEYVRVMSLEEVGTGLDLRGDGAAAGQGERSNDYPLVRFFFALPTPLPVPDGWAIGTEPGRGFPPDSPMAFLTFWNETLPMKSMSNGEEATTRVMDRLELGLKTEPRDEKAESEDSPSHESKGVKAALGSFTRKVTVVDAITCWEFSEESPTGWDGNPQNLDPKYDPIVRCVALARDVSRAFRLVNGRHIELVSYERLSPLVVLFHGTGRVDRDRLVIPRSDDWEARQIMMLNHFNLPPDVAPEEPSPELDAASAYWMRSLRSGTPAVRAREMIVESRIALMQLGEYSDAVVKANTGAEVMIDAFLSAMLWEEHFEDESKPDAEVCAAQFGEGRVKTRISSMMAPRLKGDWTSAGSPVVKWIRGPHALRHRIVHGGYQPSRQEASDALAAVDELSQFLFDRLAAQRNKFRRAAVILIGIDGLKRRDLIRGKMARFIETVAGNEVPYLESWAEWHGRLVEVSSAQ